MKWIRFWAAWAIVTWAIAAQAEGNLKRLAADVAYRWEVQVTASDGKTPLWLNANKYGLSSLEKFNGYGRALLTRPLEADSLHRWGVGWGLDVAVAHHFSSRFVVQQAFAEVRWLKGTLTLGSKEWPMELRHNALSSGAMTLGKNARPVPQVRLALPHYWTPAVLGGWIGLKGHMAFGRMTDQDWQHEFTHRQYNYTDKLLYHSKAGYLKIGKAERRFPLSAELGLEMASLFGGTTQWTDREGNRYTVHGRTGWSGWWHAFVPGGHDAVESGTAYENISGDQLGSWLIRLNYDTEAWTARLYGEHFFEDHSSMFLLDYDGYGSGAEWDVRKRNRYFFYDLKDMVLGAEFNWKRGTWLRNVVVEYLYTKYQSGPVYHDHGPAMSDHIGGVDDYYNHGVYPGWQHWGQVMGNPLLRSPLYNSDGKIQTQNNRFWALHLGIDGTPLPRLNYRLLATYQRSFGTYAKPYREPYSNGFLLAEVGYAFGGKAEGWSVKGGLGLDCGKTTGCNQGFQLTLARTGIFNSTKSTGK